MDIPILNWDFIKDNSVFQVTQGSNLQEIKTSRFKFTEIKNKIVVQSYDVALRHSDVAFSICYLKNNSCLSANEEVVIN